MYANAGQREQGQAQARYNASLRAAIRNPRASLGLGARMRGHGMVVSTLAAQARTYPVDSSFPSDGLSASPEGAQCRLGCQHGCMVEKALYHTN